MGEIGYDFAPDPMVRFFLPAKAKVDVDGAQGAASLSGRQAEWSSCTARHSYQLPTDDLGQRYGVKVCARVCACDNSSAVEQAVDVQLGMVLSMLWGSARLGTWLYVPGSGSLLGHSVALPPCRAC